ncbi:MAG TPA: sulfotransferase domain-containing protein [Candidatus Peribacterales bacterium]|nr:sulfotransferase domain-containing protein [Candidatus Peribacterales bacterium]
MPYPDFLGIGAMKGGTSWLDANLRTHPKIWMPPWKELKYFEKGMLSREPASNLRRITKFVQPSVRTVFYAHPLWMLKFFCRKKTDAWYASLFSPNKNQICGEISPEYAKLDRETVEHIHALMPNLKILFLLRNPVDRAWSHILWDYCGGDGKHNLGTIDLDSCIRHAESRSSMVRGEYSKTLEVWESAFSKEQIFIGFFEEMRDAPAELLQRIQKFLGVPEYIPESITKKVNETPGPAMPKGLKERLAKLYLTELRNLSNRFGEPTNTWLTDAEQCLQNAG